METIKLDSRDRRNIYKDDADNLFCVEAETPDELLSVNADDDFDSALTEARD
jgi:hypothetical protein